MSTKRPPVACVECGKVIAAVRTEVDPQEIDLRHRAQCDHEIDRDTANDLWRQGYRWTIPVIDGASLAAAERTRQVNDEGYTPAHDAEHADSGLPWAAWSYIDAAVNDDGSGREQGPPMMWPWAPGSWKADASPVRRLIIAAALIEAEIDRLLLADRTKP